MFVCNVVLFLDFVLPALVCVFKLHVQLCCWKPLRATVARVRVKQTLEASSI